MMARNAWASNTLRSLDKEVSNVGNSPYANIRYCRIKTLINDDGTTPNSRISVNVPRTTTAPYPYTLETEALKKIEEYEENDQKAEEQKRKIENFQSLLSEQEKKQAEYEKNAEAQKKAEEKAKEEQDRSKEKAKEEEEREEILKRFQSVTGVKDRKSIISSLEKHKWDLSEALNEATSPHLADDPSPVPQPGNSENCSITIKVDDSKYTFNFKRNQTMWDLFTELVQKSGIKQGFHFKDAQGKTYKEHMFDQSFSSLGFVPSCTLTLVKDGFNYNV